MRCKWVAKRLTVFVLTVLVLLAIAGAFGGVHAGPGDAGEPVPITPPVPNGTSVSTGDASFLPGLLFCIAETVLL